MSTVTRTHKRYWEVDTARGVAIILMAVYHTAFDLDTFGPYDIQSGRGFWLYFADFVAALFVSLAGLALTLSYARARTAGVPGRQIFLRLLRRGLIVFSLGMVITLGSLFLFPGQPIYFGILHLIGVSIPLAYPFLRFRYLNLVLGIIMAVAGFYLTRNVVVDSAWFTWLGLQPRGFFSSDYRPLLPWFGVMLLGVFVGNTLYPNGERRFAIRDLSNLSLIKALSFMGRHSLLIYFLHQPVILAVLAAFGLIDLGLF